MSTSRVQPPQTRDELIEDIKQLRALGLTPGEVDEIVGRTEAWIRKVAPLSSCEDVDLEHASPRVRTLHRQLQRHRRERFTQGVSRVEQRIARIEMLRDRLRAEEAEKAAQRRGKAS